MRPVQRGRGDVERLGRLADRAVVSATRVEAYEKMGGRLQSKILHRGGLTLAVSGRVLLGELARHALGSLPPTRAGGRGGRVPASGLLAACD